jgi:hypothetical protein
MRTKKTFFCILLLMPVFWANGQFLHIGLKAFNTPYQKMTYFQYDINDYVYYFSNEYNETIRFNGFEVSETSSYIPFPGIFLKYDIGNNLFLQADVFTSWFSNDAKYKNSVDFSEYANVFNPNSELQNLGYNNIKLKWAFMGHSFTAGYVFFKTKTLRPFVYGGISTQYLLSFKPGDYYQDTRSIRNGIIFNNLNTFKTVTFYYKLGAGFKYHGLSMDIYLQDNLGDIDKYSFSDNSQNIYHNGRPNFKGLSSINISLSFNLLSFNLIKGQSLN